MMNFVKDKSNNNRGYFIIKNDCDEIGIYELEEDDDGDELNVKCQIEIGSELMNVSLNFDENCTILIDNDFLFIVGPAQTAFIVDMEGKSKSKCNAIIKKNFLPKYAFCNAIIEVNQNNNNCSIITLGYMRQQWKKLQISDKLFPPQYIIQLIAKWVILIRMFIFCGYVPCLNDSEDAILSIDDDWRDVETLQGYGKSWMLHF